MSQLPADCLNETFEYLEDDVVTLRSCLLVNRLWCVVSVRILWRSIRNYNTLISCLPNESKEILFDNGITSAFSDPPTFNYSSFCKILSIFEANSEILKLLKNKNFDSPYNLSNIVIREICKLLMNQISLKVLNLDLFWLKNIINIPNFTIFPGAKGCLENLSELHCGSYTNPEIFYQLSKICHNLQLLDIDFYKIISNGLADLISAQQNLKHLSVTKYQDFEDDLTTPLLTNLPNTLIKLSLFGEECHVPLSFITKFTNLQEISLSFKYRDYFEDLEGFEELNYVTFSQLQVLKLQDVTPRYELLIKFLEINGKNLREIYMGCAGGESLNLAIAKFCPNLRKLLTEFYKDDSEILKVIFNSCKYLEGIIFWFRCLGLSEKDLFKVVATHSPENFYELKLCYTYQYGSQSKLLPEELESFFISWVNRVPLSLIHCKDSNTLDQNNMKIIEKYIKLGIIKKFQVLDFCEHFYDEFK